MCVTGNSLKINKLPVTVNIVTHCLLCNELINNDNKNKHYCDDSCRMKAYRLRKKTNR